MEDRKCMYFDNVLCNNNSVKLKLVGNGQIAITWCSDHEKQMQEALKLIKKYWLDP